MYANPERNEYDALVTRLRRRYGNGLEVGGYSHNDLQRLRRMDAQRQIEEDAEKAAQPLNEAMTRLFMAHRRALAAWGRIGEGQKRLEGNKRLHVLNGFDTTLLEPVAMPEKCEPATQSVDATDKATAEMAGIATDLEAMAAKTHGYANEWERMTPEQQNRALILALADRLDRLEGRA